MTTTPAALCTAIESLITGLTPAGSAVGGTETAYATTGDRETHKTWGERPDGDIDRNFQVDLNAFEFVMFGNRAEQHVAAALVIEIGHTVGRFRECRNRRLQDTTQIVSQLTWPQNARTISGLLSVKPNATISVQKIKDGKFFLSRIEIPIVFSISANYGGT